MAALVVSGAVPNVKPLLSWMGERPFVELGNVGVIVTRDGWVEGIPDLFSATLAKRGLPPISVSSSDLVDRSTGLIDREPLPFLTDLS